MYQAVHGERAQARRAGSPTHGSAEHEL